MDSPTEGTLPTTTAIIYAHEVDYAVDVPFDVTEPERSATNEAGKELFQENGREDIIPFDEPCAIPGRQQDSGNASIPVGSGVAVVMDGDQLFKEYKEVVEEGKDRLLRRKWIAWAVMMLVFVLVTATVTSGAWFPNPSRQTHRQLSALTHPHHQLPNPSRQTHYRLLVWPPHRSALSHPHRRVPIPSRSTSRPVKPHHPPITPPTAAPSLALLEVFRALLLNHSVSSSHDTRTRGTPQYDALKWLAVNDHTLNKSSPTETILQRYILAVTYYASKGVGWADQLGFLTSSSICKWNDETVKGAFCISPPEFGTIGSNKTVKATVLTVLSLYSNQLNGTIPKELGRLSSMTFLDLNSNKLRGTIPTDLGRLSSLTKLILYSNKLNGTIPTELGRLSRLKSLDFNNNQLRGSIPTELGRLSSLTYLDFHANHLSGTIPTELGRLSRLTVLSLSGNRLRGSMPSELGQLSGITKLMLSSNRLGGTVPTELRRLSRLYILSLNGNNLKGNLTPIFCSQSIFWDAFVADCLSKVNCSCCTDCT